MSTRAHAEPHLLTILGAGFGVAVAVGEAIGSGILRSPAVIAGTIPSRSIVLALWALGGVQALLGANVLAELATAIPKSGGGYLYVHRAFGDAAGLVVGWANWLSHLAGAAAASVSFAEFLPLLWPAAGAHKIAVALAVQLALYAANILGLREGRALQETTTYIKAIMLLAFVVAAAVLISPSEAGSAKASAPPFRWTSLALAYQLILGAYAGWSAPAFFAGENETPARSIPKALFLGTVLTGVLYVAINAALLHALGLQGVAASSLPFLRVLAHFQGGLPAILFAATALMTVASCANANIMTAPRILFALAEDGLLPRGLSRVNRGGSPVAGFLLSGGGTLALAATGRFVLVFSLIATLNTLSFVIVEAAFFRLRWREPGLARPFRAIGYPVLPFAALAADTVLLFVFAQTDRAGMLAAAAMILLCIPLAAIARRAAAPT